MAHAPRSLSMAALLLLAPSLVAQRPADDGRIAAKSGWIALSANDAPAVEQYSSEYKSYLLAAKSAGLSNAELIRLAKAGGFRDAKPGQKVAPGDRLIFNERDRSLALAVVGSDPLTSGSRVIAAHQDSPHLNLKPRPITDAPGSMALFKTTIYGGIKRYQWANLPLALVGRIDTTDGRYLAVNIGFAPDDPVFVIADNAPHSDTPLRSRNYTEVFGGEEMMPVAGSKPAQGMNVSQQVMSVLRERFNIRDYDLVSSELELVPATLPRDVGFDRGLVGSWGQDDKASAYAAVHALLNVKGTPSKTAIAYISNFEEVGSVNNTGAHSEFLPNVYSDLLHGAGSNASDFDLRTSLTQSYVLSADCNDGVNPIFPQTSELTNAAVLGYGVTVKRYGAGFDPNSEFTSKVLALLIKSEIPWQTQTPKGDVGRGGTIGGFLSARDMEVLDVGIPLLSMHSTYEMSSKVDLWNYQRFMHAFYTMP